MLCWDRKLNISVVFTNSKFHATHFGVIFKESSDCLCICIANLAFVRCNEFGGFRQTLIFSTLMDHGFRKVLCLALDGNHVYHPGPGFGIVEVWSIGVWRELSFQVHVG